MPAPHHGHIMASAHGLPALEMTKWFDTNYHYMVPEFGRGQTFSLASTKPLDEFLAAKASVSTRGRCWSGRSPTSCSARARIRRFGAAVASAQPPAGLRRGAAKLQAPAPTGCRSTSQLCARPRRQGHAGCPAARLCDIRRPCRGLKLMLATYFGALGDNLGRRPEAAGRRPARRPGSRAGATRALLDKAPADLVLSLGIIDGRNVWRADLERCWIAGAAVDPARGADRIVLAPSCSLLHVPVDLGQEDGLDDDLKSWLAFAVQKVDELAIAGPRSQSGPRRGQGCALSASSCEPPARKTSPARFTIRRWARMRLVDARDGAPARLLRRPARPSAPGA
jgi:5-methyltetrahydropteroyltriglutamate--homocysteine methyltransferase